MHHFAQSGVIQKLAGIRGVVPFQNKVDRIGVVSIAIYLVDTGRPGGMASGFVAIKKRTLGYIISTGVTNIDINHNLITPKVEI